jgi:hypothetical protein
MGASKPQRAARKVAGAERMKAGDKMRTIKSVKAKPPTTLMLRWSNGTRATIDFVELPRAKAYRSLRDPDIFALARVGEWGHSVEWPGDVELGADSLWLDTLSATGRADTRAFLEWRLRNGLSLAGAADALGLSRRMVAYYSNGEKPVPKSILLACKGWEVDRAA